MTLKRLVLFAGMAAMLMAAIPSPAHAQQGQAAKRMYNTAKQKMLAGKPLIGGTVSSPDPNIYCAMASAGFDFLWIEMQHSPLTYSDVAKMIWACRGTPAMPFIRVPDATESDIQKATDIGALGIIVPTVDTVEKAEATVRWSKYPPQGRRSQGGGQYGALWGSDYHQTINDNMMVVIMIETPIGVDNAEKIAAVPGVDVIFAASTDLGNFSGYKQGDPQYERMVTRIHDVTLKQGLRLGGPIAWKDTRQGFTFFQAGGETALIRAGAEALGFAPGGRRPGQPAPQGKRGIAPTEGTEPR
jgi:2-keto-3-deoxy-L-rhamnonate aldolase RhmA